MAGTPDFLQTLLQPVVESLGYEFWGLDFGGRGRTRLLRVYIDGPEGINVEDCARVSRQISALLDVEDPISGEYTLEVSSPGLDRPIFTLDQYARLVGQQAKITLRDAYDGRKNFTGLLKGVEQDEVILQVDAEEFCFPIETLDRGRLVPYPDSNKD